MEKYLIGEDFRIGIDLGGTKIEAVLLGPAQEQVFRKRILTPGGNQYQDIIKAVFGLIDETRGKIPESRTHTIGIGIPGAVRKDTGQVQNANTTCLIGRTFQKDMETLCGQPVAVENDANCFTLTEAVLGAGKPYDMVFGHYNGNRMRRWYLHRAENPKRAQQNSR